MPRDGIADAVENAIDPLTALPAWVKGEKRLSMMLPYVSLVNDRTIRTRGNELMQCIRLEGVNSITSEDGHLDRIGRLLAGIVAQVGTEFSFYLHKVSKAVDVTLPPIPGEGFAAAIDKRWHAHLGRAGLRDKTLTLTVLKRPEVSSRLPFGLGASRSRHAADTTRRLRKLDEVVGFLLSSFDELKPRLLAASTGELLGFLGSLNTGEEHPLFPRSRLGVIAEDVANTRVTFRGTTIALSDGAVGDKLGAIFAVKNYPAKTDSLMLDELNLPVDMVVTHSFVPINANIMAGRIKRQLRLMQAANDGAVSLAQELELAQDDLESKRLIFGEHHMTVAVYARSQAALDDIAAEIRNISATSGINLISEAFGARAHFMAQHPGNTGARSRKAAITNHNFADLATFHRTPLGKTGREVPWGVPITLFPTPERSGFRFNFHEQGAQDPFADSARRADHHHRGGGRAAPRAAQCRDVDRGPGHGCPQCRCALGLNASHATRPDCPRRSPRSRGDDVSRGNQHRPRWIADYAACRDPTTCCSPPRHRRPENRCADDLCRHDRLH